MDKDNKIIYICPNFPFPANSGEEHCLEKHIEELSNLSKKVDIELVFSNFKNADVKPLKYNVKNKIFKTKFSNINNKILKMILYFLFSLLPFETYPMYKIKTNEELNYIKMKNSDVIIVDTLMSTALLPKNKTYKLVYISHNIESNLAIDLYKMQKNIFYKLYYYFNYLKIKKIESMILKSADKIVCISTSDYDYFKGIYPNKVEFLPHRIELQKNSWEGKGEKSLFFCGPLNFAPNYDSVKWIAEELSPVLAKDIKIKITGKGTDNVPEEWKKDNIEYLGFVSREELLDLYRNSSAFICPIVYGSGVKIKVTEALGFGTPVIATKEALEGLDYIKIEPLIDRSDLQKTKENIEMLLNNQSKLQEYSSNVISQIETYQRKNDNSLEKIIGEFV